MRLKACIEIGIKDIPCKVLENDTPIEKLQAYTIKDNIGYGEHDFDLLANEWDIDKLDDWGVDLPGIELDEEYYNAAKERIIMHQRQLNLF